MKKLAIVGCGGFAREVKWLVDRINEKQPQWNLIGFIDEDKNNINVIGNDDYILSYNNEIYVVIAIGSSSLRERLYNLYKNNPNVKFPNLIDPSVLLSDSVKLGEGNIFCAGTILTVNILIGNFNIINLDCTVGHDTIIENFITVNPSVNISGNVHIFSGCNIGTGTQIIQGRSVGEKTIVGAGSVIVKDLPVKCTAVGCPAKPIKFFD